MNWLDEPAIRPEKNRPDDFNVVANWQVARVEAVEILACCKIAADTEVVPRHRKADRSEPGIREPAVNTGWCPFVDLQTVELLFG
jgi:hypothetical protein